MMSDIDLIGVLRRRLERQDRAIHAFLDVMERTGRERQRAWEGMGREGGWHTEDTIDAFLETYERTMPERLAAAEALQRALTMTFEEAIVSANDMTDAQRAYWIERVEEEAKP